jgi:phosphomannomutase
MNYLFDVDGTLTPHRQRMNNQFNKWFGLWVNEQQSLGDKVYLVTGSDKKKTIQQVGICLYRSVNGCYQNCGNQLYIRSRLIKESRWEIGAEVRLRILEMIEKSLWYRVSTSNIEERVGMINISTIGRDCTSQQRKDYHSWDKHSRERESIAKTIMEEYPELDASIGGMISIDIYPKGKNKSQVIDDMTGETIFFGDNCQKGGNDYEISRAVDFYYEVDNDKDTRKLLTTIGAS